MPKRINAFECHDFYCINCGHKGIPITRQSGHKRGTGHRKLLYCPFCKHTVNHIEVSNEFEAKEFMEAFLNGAFAEEAALELQYETEHPKYQNVLRGLK